MSDVRYDYDESWSDAEAIKRFRAMGEPYQWRANPLRERILTILARAEAAEAEADRLRFALDRQSRTIGHLLRVKSELEEKVEAAEAKVAEQDALYLAGYSAALERETDAVMRAEAAEAKVAQLVEQRDAAVLLRALADSAMDNAAAERDALQAKVAAVEALHRHDGRHGCVTCLDVDAFPHPWPCDTALALATEATP